MVNHRDRPISSGALAPGSADPTRTASKLDSATCRADEYRHYSVRRWHVPDKGVVNHHRRRHALSGTCHPAGPGIGSKLSTYIACSFGLTIP
ncbi:hypothetical protein Pla123a_34310 [Posidoniimonas polymericola]|uniref:Uncharacterized protein n=1 Tax=Posidoniimonas polymericola TaxID=2528002 RepID=A0A5C5YIB4_9BACT|nr:hypothetical protein Pla123a_34310 [Posidoniimonas polymericola]